MQTLPVTKDNEAKVLKALADCSLFRALKPEQLAAAAEGRGARRLRAQRDHRPAGRALRLLPGRDRRHGRGHRRPRRRRGPARPDPAAQQPGRGEPPPPRAAHRHRHRAGNVQALKFSAKAFDAMFKKIPEFGTALAEGLAYRLQRLTDRIEIPGAVRPQPPAAEVLDMLPMELIQRHRILPLRVDDNVLTLGLVDPPDHPGHHRRPGAAALPRGAAAAHRDRVLQRRARAATAASRDGRSRRRRRRRPAPPPPRPPACRSCWSAWSRKARPTSTSPPGTSPTGGSTAT